MGRSLGFTLPRWADARPGRAGWGLLVGAILLVAQPAEPHPLGNFSVSHYAGLRIEADRIELRYLVDMAEIPAFQEIQDAGIVPDPDHPSLPAYLARKVGALREGLRVEVNGRRLALEGRAPEVIFPAGAGGLPTLKLGIWYRATLDGMLTTGPNELRYRDENFPGRAGWKEVVAAGGPGVTLLHSSVPEVDRSRALTDYPTDLLNSPPQDLEAGVLFTRAPVPAAVARAGTGTPGGDLDRRRARPGPTTASAPTDDAGRAAAQRAPEPAPPASRPAGVELGGHGTPIGLQANRQATPRSALAEMVIQRELGLGIVLIALAVAVGLGAVHALEPGHGKTVVAAYLVGSRGTARHALLLGLIVTASHTAGVYLLGAVTLYASWYVVPERLYPWLGVASGLTIAGLGCALFLRRYAGAAHAHSHAHPHLHDPPHEHGPAEAHGPNDPPGQAHGVHGHHHHAAADAVSLRQLLALGVTGGIVPCPAALVVLLSAVSLHRVGFGLLLIVAFSVGLAAVLIGIGLLVVYAHRFMSRFQGEGPLITRWLPLSSAAVITVFGVAITVQSLEAAGILHIMLR